MSRALPLVLAAVISAGTAGAALFPDPSVGGSSVIAQTETPITQVGPPADWNAAGMAAARGLAAKKAADAKAAAEERLRKARALQRASRARRSAAVSYGSPKAIARAQLAARGWSGQFGCLDRLWTRESGWRVTASNPSGAYGIPQALPGSKMASAGSDWRTNPATQIRWGLGYIASVYGGPCNAWAHSQSHNWY
jgi:hypothetical protein